jgi:hypothetical protein
MPTTTALVGTTPGCIIDGLDIPARVQLETSTFFDIQLASPRSLTVHHRTHRHSDLGTLGATSALPTFSDSTPTSSASRAHHDDAQDKCYLQLIFLRLPYISSIVSVTFANLFYTLFPALFSLPFRRTRGLGVADLDMLGGLALPISGSSDLRDITNFCAFSL